MAAKPTSRRKRPTKAEQRAATMEQIFDAAEHLFSRHGLYGVTLKDVAKRVGVHHTLMNYYFDDKKDLFDKVFARRAVVSSSRRMKALDDYEASVDKPTVEGALRIFLNTDLDLYMEGGNAWKNATRLAAQVANTPGWGAQLMDENFDAVVLRLIGLLKRALPGSTEEDIFWSYHFVTGALLHVLARTGRIDRLSGGICKSDDFLAVKARMVTFMAAGILAVCKGRSRASKG